MLAVDDADGASTVATGPTAEGFVLAVDAGGTSTRCAVADTSGRCLGYHKTGSGNPVSAGPDAALASFVSAIEAALAQAGVDGDQVVQVVFSMAGGLTIDGLSFFAGRRRQSGVAAHPVLEADLLGNFYSGTWEPSGYLLDSGTGAGAIRVEGGAMAEFADGLGWLLGDDGSGFWIGARVVRAAFADLDRRGPATALTDLLIAQLGVELDRPRVPGRRPPVVEDALHLIYQLRPVELSRFARLAFEAADDAVARAILDGAAEQLVHTLLTVAKPGVDGPVVFAGGVLTRNPDFMDRVASLLAAELPAAAAFVPVEDGMAGAVVLALRHLGVTVGEAEFNTVSRTLAELPTR
jgi:N-acetylglucosamine kinase-like BadF-type ATPase